MERLSAPRDALVSAPLTAQRPRPTADRRDGVQTYTAAQAPGISSGMDHGALPCRDAGTTNESEEAMTRIPRDGSAASRRRSASWNDISPDTR